MVQRKKEQKEQEQGEEGEEKEEERPMRLTEGVARPTVVPVVLALVLVVVVVAAAAPVLTLWVRTRRGFEQPKPMREPNHRGKKKKRKPIILLAKRYNDRDFFIIMKNSVLHPIHLFLFFSFLSSVFQRKGRERGGADMSQATKKHIRKKNKNRIDIVYT